MDCAPSSRSLILKLPEKSTQKIVVASCVLWKFFYSLGNRRPRSDSSGAVTQAILPATSLKERSQDCLRHRLQVCSFFATGRSFMPESISEWKQCSKVA